MRNFSSAKLGRDVMLELYTMSSPIPASAAVARISNLRSIAIEKIECHDIRTSVPDDRRGFIASDAGELHVPTIFFGQSRRGCMMIRPGVRKSSTQTGMILIVGVMRATRPEIANCKLQNAS